MLTHPVAQIVELWNIDRFVPCARHPRKNDATADRMAASIQELMRWPILKHLRRGELVYDPFLGSGTTLAAAELTARVCYGIELDPK